MFLTSVPPGPGWGAQLSWQLRYIKPLTGKQAVGALVKVKRELAKRLYFQYIT
jgi:hypothetical protein